MKLTYGQWRVQRTGAYIAIQRRLSALISLSPEERYASFTAVYPALVRRGAAAHDYGSHGASPGNIAPGTTKADSLKVKGTLLLVALDFCQGFFLPIRNG